MVKSLIVGLVVFSSFSADAAGPRGRGFSAGTGILSLNGTEASAFLKEVGGGDIEAAIQTSPISGGGSQKSIGGYTISDLNLLLNPTFSKPLQQSIETFVKGQQATATDYSILSCDFNQKIVEENQYKDGFISRFAFPALDATSKELVAFEIQYSAEQVQTTKGTGASCPSAGAKEKAMTLANFNLQIAAVDTTGVVRVSPITFKQSIVKSQVGAARLPQGSVGAFEIENFEITVLEHKAADFQKWFSEFVIQGQSGQSDEKSVTINLLDQALKKALISVTLHNVGIYKMAKSTDASGSQAAQTVTFSFYAETATFSYNK